MAAGNPFFLYLITRSMHFPMIPVTSSQARAPTVTGEIVC